jgi:hypothetical protein
MSITNNFVTKAIADHPVITLAGVGGLVLLFMLRGSGSSSAAPSGVGIITQDPNVIAANMQITMAHDALQATNAQTAAAVEINAQNTAAAKSLAEISANKDIATATLATSASNYQANLAAQTAKLQVGGETFNKLYSMFAGNAVIANNLAGNLLNNIGSLFSTSGGAPTPGQIDIDKAAGHAALKSVGLAS